MITIAGRQVEVGDPLYHITYRAWGTVIGYDGAVAKLQIAGSNGQQRTLHVQQGGLVNNSRVIYWHEPLTLDLPFQNVGTYQRMVNALKAEINP